MHELSLVSSMLEIVAEYAERHGFERVNALRLSYGRLSCIEEQALVFGFEVLAQGSCAAGARLIFEVCPAVVHCLDCGQDSRVDHPGACPLCGSGSVILVSGTEELKLLELDVD